MEPIQAKGYGFRVMFNGDMIVIDRNRLVASTYGFAQTVVPLGSIVDVTLGKATIFVNGLFCLSVRTVDGDSPLIASSTKSRKSPYSAICTKQHEREFRRLYEAIKREWRRWKHRYGGACRGRHHAYGHNASFTSMVESFSLSQ